ncbi:dipeptidase 1-like [Aedes albopictus]|uniref:Dipeptidase n=1 Tax=Aedes albopictus TaxID=7160 RepID=A0ABM1Z4N8_AEDAL
MERAVPQPVVIQSPHSAARNQPHKKFDSSDKATTPSGWAVQQPAGIYTDCIAGYLEQWDLPSRQWLAVTSILLIAGAAGVAVPFALKVSAGAPLEERIQAATQLLDTVPLIDGHNDLPWNIRKFLHNQLNEFRFEDDLKQISPWSKSAWSHTDLQRLKRGRIAAQFWAAYVPCEAQHKDAVQITLEQIDVIKRLTERYSPHLTACASVYDIVQAHKNHQMCSLIGVEGGHSLGGSLGVLRIYYALGVRYMTLTSTCHTPWADSSNADGPKYDIKHGGLTAYGKTIVREMNRLGMIVDLSKSSVATMKDVLATSQAPVIFSHSSAYALCNSSRNVQDEVLQLVTKNRGLVMVNFYNKFLSCTENATVEDAVGEYPICLSVYSCLLFFFIYFHHQSVCCVFVLRGTLLLVLLNIYDIGEMVTAGLQKGNRQKSKME